MALMIGLKNVPLAMVVTVDNMEEVARWCHGTIKGTALPREQREIEIVNPGHDELRARVTDYIVWLGMVDINRAYYSVYSAETFRGLFQ